MENIENKPTTRVEKKATKKKAKSPLTTSRKIKLVIIAILFLFVGYILIFQIAKPLVNSGRPLSIMLVGSDISEYREETKQGTKPEKTDSLMVVTFDPNTYKFVTTSIPRDTAVDYTCSEQRSKINEVYPASGNDINCLKDTVSNFLNVPIDYYVKVNLDQIVDIIDQIGTLKITAHAADGYLYQETVDGSASYEWIDGETYEMSSEEALTYARARHDSEVDYGRGLRQQQVIVSMAKSLLEQGLSMDLVKNIFALVDTDMEPLLMKEYYDYANQLQYIVQHMESGEKMEEKKIPSSVVNEMKKYFKYKESSNEDFQTYVFNNFSQEEIKSYFFESLQFVNISYNGFYIADEDQRYEISNKLRSNLGLKKETPPDYQYEFATNDFGCEVSSSNSCGVTTTTVTNAVEESTTGDEVETTDNTYEEDNVDETAEVEQPEEVVNEAPTITIAQTNVSINFGEEYTNTDLIGLFGVSATDVEDGDLEVVVDSSGVDYTTPGSYSVSFSVTDSLGEVATVSGQLDIINNEEVVE